MALFHLTDRTVISVSGPDAEHFLQNILTADLDRLGAGAAKPGALLTPQGKILFDFLISRTGENVFWLECRTDTADDFMRRLMLYKLRAKVEIIKLDQTVVSVSWLDESGSSQSDSTASSDESISVRDLRFVETDVHRHYGKAIPAADGSNDWNAFRIAHGIAESGSDYALGDAFPHDVLLDQLGGVGFRKGCYVGQEVVSRMQHRGTARRRVLIVSASAPLPAPGTELTVEGRVVGALGSVYEATGLAIARIDRVKDAMDSGAVIAAAGVPVTLAIPGWAKFTFPEEPAAAEEA